ncbi:hypothetical protein H5410_022802 [Solanum commersonii]|uniref:Uncharacterized protein n=1 Tax=Solanum commersonii TaxID=4109 RepID=A0A9J5ZF26_SOLCO|nr:hypothetical protein H5410_022802 [Solanum commersonii]
MQQQPIDLTEMKEQIGYVFNKLKLYHNLSYHLLLDLFRPTSTSPNSWYSQPLTPNWHISARPLHMPELSQYYFSHLVRHGDHSHLASQNIVPNHISPSLPTHSSEHPHLLYIHPLNVGVLK